jgi:sialidase-1
MTAKPYSGRLVIPCDHIEAGTKKYFSHTIHSDDGGQTWQLGGSTPSDQVNECTVAELPDGKLMLNMRNYNQIRVRRVSTSTDGGATWSELVEDPALIEPVCQGSLLSCKGKGRKTLLAFSNPANAKTRTHMTVKVSDDLGKTWKRQKLLYEGPSAYSNLVLLPNGNLACLYESGLKSAYERIVFEEIPWLDIK